MTEKTKADKAESDLSKVRTRSPNYPAINLKLAAEKVRSIYDAIRRHATGTEVVMKAMGHGEKSSQGRLAIAAMRAYGLVQDTEDGLVKLSDRALVLIDYNADSPEVKDALRAAALGPPIYQKLWSRYSADMPADDELRRYLVRDLGYNDNVVASLIADYKKAVGYSGLANAKQNEKNGETSSKGPKVGDFVQWAPGGVDQFTVPLQVIAMSPEGDFAFVRESNTGLPMTELTVVEPSFGHQTSGGKSPPANPHYKPQVDPPQENMAKEFTTLAEGSVSLNLPKELCADSVEDLDYWVRGILKKYRRAAGMKEER